MPAPGAQEQVAFLADLQRLLDEGQFTATYKFALLLSLADLAVELGDDSGEPLTLRLEVIAERFVSLYWGHARPFPAETGPEPALLSQNLGQNIALLREITALQREHPSIAEARATGRWNRLIGHAAHILVDMPLLRLQTLRSGAKEFLYDNDIAGDAITLKAGVACHLRRFHVLIQHLVRSAWVRHIRSNPRNSNVLGTVLDLEEFLFDIKRAQYPRIKEALRGVQQGQCFYCRRAIRGEDALDHFIPWSKYPSDLGHNFVLADHACNADKSDLLPALRFRDAWEERNSANESVLVQAFEADRIAHNLPASRSIASWAYAITEQSGTLLWAPA